MPKAQPALASTRRQLAIIRTYLRKHLKFDERYSPEEGASYFDIRSEGPVPMTVHFVHTPGTLAMFAVFCVKPKRARTEELHRFANLVNQRIHSACLFVREDRRIVLRTSIDYHRVKNIDSKYIASSLITLLDLQDLVDLPLILIAKGATAKQALQRTWKSTKASPIRFSELAGLR